MTKEENDKITNRLGSRYGFKDQEQDNGEANPVENALAINAWHAALARVIAYVWDKWDDQEELDNVVKYPEYYLIQFGFFPQIPAYQTKIKFVIRKDDEVTFKYGNQEKGGIIKTLPEGKEEKAYTVDMAKTPAYLSKSDKYTAGIIPLTELQADKSDEQIRELINKRIKDKTSELANGWQFEGMSELTGCFIVAIPPRPDIQPDSCQGTDEGLLKTQALNDFMDICRSQPFTSC